MKTFILYTNRNAMVFNDKNEQEVLLQSSIDCYHIDKVIAQKAIDFAEGFSRCA